MKPTAMARWGNGLLMLAVLAPSGTRADAIVAHTDDANYQTNAAANLVGTAPEGVTSKELYVGRKYYGDTLHHVVVPFQLPDLGPGTFTGVTASFHPRDPSYGDSHWDIPVNLWAIPGSRAASGTLGSDVRTASENHLARGSLVMAGYLGRHTERGTMNATPWGGAEAARLAAWLNSAYQDGAGHGRFVFLRLSPQALTPDEAGPSSANCGFGIGADPFVNASFQPYLTYNFVSAEPLAPAVSTFLATPDAVAAGAPVTLSWSVAGADAVEIYPGIGTVAASGSIVVEPSFTTTYTLYASNSHGERVASTAVNVLPPPASEIEAHLRDARFRTSPATGAVSSAQPEDENESTIYVGRRAGGSQLEHCVIPFRLPDLGPGIFTGVRVSMLPGTGDGATPGIDVNLFALPGARDSAITLASDVNDGTSDHRSRGVLVQPAWWSDATPLGTTATTPASGAAVEALNAWLTDAYANGANAGKHVFLRLSPALLDVPAATGFRVASSNHPTASARPRIAFGFLANAPPPPSIGDFSAAPAALLGNEAATLSWSVAGADEIRIDPGIGTVGASGARQVAPAATTAYTLTARNGSGTRTKTVLVGVGPFRYYRFVPLALRGGGNTVQLAEFQILRDGTRVTGATASNPGGSNPGAEGPEKSNDDLPGTKWLDFNKQPLVLDFGVAADATGYRFVTANDAAERDPVAWRVEGSHDGARWRVLDERNGYPTPVARFTYLPALALPDMSVQVAPPRMTRVELSADRSQVVLTWNSRAGASYTIQTTVNPADPASWSTAESAIPSGGASTTRAVGRDAAARRFYRVAAEP